MRWALVLSMLIIGFMLYRAEREIVHLSTLMVDNQLEVLSQTDSLHKKLEGVNEMVRKRLPISKPLRYSHTICNGTGPKGTNPNGCGGLPKTN